jgi:arylsulfatase A-like enzyme
MRMRRVVVVILDGLRRDFIDPDRTPHLHAFATRATSFAAHRSVFPSATRCVSACFATGCYPARHGLQGNAMALLENGVLVPHDAGKPDFLQHKRAVTGRSLAVPTLAERLAPHGGVVIVSNVSPGAAYAHDPDGFGHVHHRAGSFAPGRVPIGRLPVTLDAAGDRIATDHFITTALQPAGPAFALLWCAEPDHVQHDHPLGSPTHLAVLAEADRNAGAVIAAVDRLRQQGDNVLLLVGSDHGHQTVGGLVDVEGELIQAGLKSGRESTEVLAQSNGTSTLIYLAPGHDALRPALAAFLRSRDWAGTVLGVEDLATVGQAPDNGLAFAVSLRASDAPNPFGVPGTALAAMPRGGEAHPVGAGQHGGLATYEQSPFLMIDGDGFAAGAVCTAPSRIVDIAPTILTHLRLPATGMDGAALQSLPGQG